MTSPLIPTNSPAYARRLVRAINRIESTVYAYIPERGGNQAIRTVRYSKALNCLLITMRNGAEGQISLEDMEKTFTDSKDGSLICAER